MYDAGSFARLGEIRAQVDPGGLFGGKTHIPVADGNFPSRTAS